MVSKTSKNSMYECQLLGLTLSSWDIDLLLLIFDESQLQGLAPDCRSLGLQTALVSTIPQERLGSTRMLHKAQGRVIASLQICCFSFVWRSIWLSEPCNIKLVQPFSLGRRDLFTQTSELLIQFARGNLTESLTQLLLSLYVGLQLQQG